MSFDRNKFKSPIQSCLNCSERHAGCHGTCSKYAAEKAAYEAGVAEMRKDYNASWDYANYRYKAAARVKKRAAKK